MDTFKQYFKLFLKESGVRGATAEYTPAGHEKIKTTIKDNWSRRKPDSGVQPMFIAGTAGIGKTVGVQQAALEIAKNEVRKVEDPDTQPKRTSGVPPGLARINPGQDKEAIAQIDREIEADDRKSREWLASLKESSFYQLSKLLNEEKEIKGKYLVELTLQHVMSPSTATDIRVTDTSKNEDDEDYRLVWNIEEVKSNLKNSIILLEIRPSELPPQAIIGALKYVNNAAEYNERRKNGKPPKETAVEVDYPGEMSDLIRARNDWEGAEGIVFLDELTRVLDNVMLNSLMAWLDGDDKIGIPKDKWVVVTAGNTGKMFEGYVKDIQDSAIENRLARFELKVPGDDWIKWAEGGNKVHEHILDYIKDDRYKPFDVVDGRPNIPNWNTETDPNWLKNPDIKWDTSEDTTFHGKLYVFKDAEATEKNQLTRQQAKDTELQQAKATKVSDEKLKEIAAELSETDAGGNLTGPGAAYWQVVTPRSIEKLSKTYTNLKTEINGMSVSELVEAGRVEDAYKQWVNRIQVVDKDHPWIQGFFAYLTREYDKGPDDQIDTAQTIDQIKTKFDTRLKTKLGKLYKDMDRLIDQECIENPTELYNEIEKLPIVNQIVGSFPEANPDTCTVEQSNQGAIVDIFINNETIMPVLERLKLNLNGFKQNQNFREHELLLKDLYFIISYLVILGPQTTERQQPGDGLLDDGDDIGYNVLGSIGNLCNQGAESFRQIQKAICGEINVKLKEGQLPAGWSSAKNTDENDDRYGDTYYYQTGPDGPLPDTVTYEKPE